MKINNLWRIIWIVGIYAVLISILYLVVLYKVKWEDRDLNTYLYFYDCGTNLCTTDQKVDKYYTYVLCEDDICPYILDQKDDLVILGNKDKNYLFSYKRDKIVSDEYLNYRFTNDNYYIVTDSNNMQCLIDNDGKVIVNCNYEKINDYKDGFISYVKSGKMGIIGVGEIDANIIPQYEDIVLINNTLYAYYKDDTYYISSYTSDTPISEFTYDYIYAAEDAILVARNNQIDILNTNLHSNLLLKIDSKYAYRTEKERNSLQLYVSDHLLHFTVYDNENAPKKYIYDIRNAKLYN